jgi:hypothetical protein
MISDAILRGTEKKKKKNFEDNLSSDCRCHLNDLCLDLFQPFDAPHKTQRECDKRT